jgi:hypothetical protein
MRILIDGLTKLVRSFTTEQRQLIKSTVHACLDSYSKLPSFVTSPVKTALDKMIDRFLDDTPDTPAASTP